MAYREDNCVGMFYDQIKKDGGNIPDTTMMRYWVWDFLKNSIAGSSRGANYWSKSILDETLPEHKEAVRKTLKDFFPDSIGKKYPEYCL